MRDELGYPGTGRQYSQMRDELSYPGTGRQYSQAVQPDA